MRCIGAVVGDIIGSVYEFNNIKTKSFTLFSEGNEWTDDSILTVATMKALLDGGEADNYKFNYQLLGNKYPSSYGVRFSKWLLSDNPQPYGSLGNGSASRVSPTAWFYNTIEAVEHAAALSASISHNHPEGLKGAQATAAAIFMARTGRSKTEINLYLQKRFRYFLDFSLDDIRSSYTFDETCAGTVPPAIVAFLESTGFEDAIRIAISLGGDSDTLAAITGSVAEAFYGIPADIRTKAFTYLPNELVAVIERFNNVTLG